MTRAELIQSVSLRMDEITPGTALTDIAVDGSDNNPLYALIDGLIDSGVLELYSIAPYWRLFQTDFTETAYEQLAVNDRYVLRIKVPDDFLRVAEIDCTGFQRPIVEVHLEQSDAGKRQHNRFLMGKEAKPVGVLSHGMWDVSGANEDPELVPCREIDCYSLTGVSDGGNPPTIVPPSVTVTASYIPVPEQITDDLTTPVAVEDVVPSELIPALEWLIASRTFGARGDTNHAAICQQNAQNLLV